MYCKPLKANDDKHEASAIPNSQAPKWLTQYTHFSAYSHNINVLRKKVTALLPLTTMPILYF